MKSSAAAAVAAPPPAPVRNEGRPKTPRMLASDVVHVRVRGNFAFFGLADLKVEPFSNFIPSASGVEGIACNVMGHCGVRYAAESVAFLFVPRHVPVTSNELRDFGNGSKPVYTEAVRTQLTRALLAGNVRRLVCPHEGHRMEQVMPSGRAVHICTDCGPVTEVCTACNREFEVRTADGRKVAVVPEGAVYLPAKGGTYMKVCTRCERARELPTYGKWLTGEVSGVDYIVSLKLLARSDEERAKYTEMLMSRLRSGRFWRPVHLGIREMVARLDFVSSFSDLAYPDMPLVEHEGGLKTADYNMDLGLSWYGTDYMAEPPPNYFTPMSITKGVLKYPSWESVRRRGIKREGN